MKGLTDPQTGKFVRNLKDKKCLVCESVFHPRFEKRKLCSRKCLGVFLRKNHDKKCRVCEKMFYSRTLKTKFCSHECYGKTIEKPKKVKVTSISTGMKYCIGCKEMFYVSKYRIKVAKFCSVDCSGSYRKGEKHYHWKGGVDLRDRRSLFNPDYVQWRKKVFSRDNWKCKIANVDCEGQLEAHHILPWRDFVELRFEINNGITLCHAHHPRKRDEEAKLSPYFQQLVAERN